MDRSDVLAALYLAPHRNTLCTWSDDGNVLVWRDGTTIAFREELAAILTLLAAGGGPPLGGLALLIAATRAGWDPGEGETGILSDLIRQVQNYDQDREVLEQVIAGLHRIHQLPSELRSSVNAKAALADLVFGPDTRRLSAARTQAVAESLAQGPCATRRGDKTGLCGELASESVASLLSLFPGITRIDEATVRMRLRTGLDAPPAPAEVELPPPQAARNLIQSLVEEPELAGLAVLAQRLLAVTPLPRPLRPDLAQPVGGVSDIANRGDLQQLLISELAYDDLTLAVRLAMNEAMYLRREAPPAAPAGHRHVLLDVGIRSWGVPRIYITAVALAIAATTPPQGTISCYRGERAAIVPVDLVRRGSLIEHLQAIAPDLDLAPALAAFQRRLEQDDPNLVDTVLVMTEEAFAATELRQAIADLRTARVFVATVSCGGHFQLFHRRARGFKAIREATLDLEALFERPPLLTEPTPGELPALFRVAPFPLLLSHNVNPDRTWFVEPWGAVAATSDGRVTLWTGTNQGPLLLGDELPCRDIRAVMSGGNQGELAFVTGVEGQLSLLLIDCSTSSVEVLPLQYRGGASFFCLHHGVLFIGYEDRVHAISTGTGEVVDTLRISPYLKHVRDRFFQQRETGAWYALSYDGDAATLEQVPIPSSGGGGPLAVAALFDCAGKDGPLGISADGRLFDTATGEVRSCECESELKLEPLRDGYCRPWFAVDGREISVAAKTASGHTRRVFIEPLVGTAQARYSCSWNKDPRIVDRVRPENLRHRFNSIGITSRGHLGLLSRKNHLLVFCLTGEHAWFAAADDGEVLSIAGSFTRVTAPDLQIKLWTASGANGSEAVLDSRGLLHLRPGNGMAEVTLVLSEGELTGWSSSGTVCGRSYFLAPATVNLAKVSPRLFFETHVDSFAEAWHA